MFHDLCGLGDTNGCKDEAACYQDRFMKRIRTGAIYEITVLWVCEGGESVHSHFHLQFNEVTEMKL